MILKLSSLVLASSLMALPFSPTAQGALLWSDEFTSATLDSSVWTYDIGTGNWGWGNGELQTYTSSTSNVQVQNDNLVITALDDGTQFTSARVKTQGKVEFQYGTVEASIKLSPVGDGLWPAFWMLGGNFAEVGWPACGELDILEMGETASNEAGVAESRMSSAAHWEDNDQYAGYFGTYDSPIPLTDGNFHTFRMEWTPTLITTYVDGIEAWAFDISPKNCVDCSEFHQPHFLVLNMAVGGRFTGLTTRPEINAAMPAEYVIEYVRIYGDANTILTGTAINPPVFNIDCGIPSTCTDAVLSTYAGDYMCGARMVWLIDNGTTEADACQQIAQTDFPTECGQCDPNAASRQSNTVYNFDCGVPNTCTQSVLNTFAGAYTCGDRITYLMGQGSTESQACLQVATLPQEWPDECGPCDPTIPSPTPQPTPSPTDQSTPSPTPQPTPSPTDQSTPSPTPQQTPSPTDQSKLCGAPNLCNDIVLDTDAAGHSCRARITCLQDVMGDSEAEACRQVAGVEHPNECGECILNVMNCNQPATCTDAVLDTVTDVFTCRERISWLVYALGHNETTACEIIARDQFPNQCGACIPP